jgi:hypothetical protein
MSDKLEIPQEVEGAEIRQPGLRFLEMAVYIMGGLLVLMLVGLIGGIIWKIAHKGEQQAPATQLLNLGLDSTTQVQQVQLDGDRLMVSTAAEIIIIDIRRNAIISRIAFKAK